MFSGETLIERLRREEARERAMQYVREEEARARNNVAQQLAQASDKFLGTCYGVDIYEKSEDSLARERISNMGLKNKKAFKSYEEKFDELINKYENLDTDEMLKSIIYGPLIEKIKDQFRYKKPTFKDKLLTHRVPIMSFVFGLLGWAGLTLLLG